MHLQGAREELRLEARLLRFEVNSVIFAPKLQAHELCSKPSFHEESWPDALGWRLRAQVEHSCIVGLSEAVGKAHHVVELRLVKEDRDLGKLAVDRVARYTIRDKLGERGGKRMRWHQIDRAGGAGAEAE